MASYLPVSCILIVFEKPVLFPWHAVNGIVVTRGFLLDPKPAIRQIIPTMLALGLI
jgi:hypothetical protein